MRPSTIWYNTRQGFKNIRRNWMFSLASVITMAACIFLFGLFYVIVNNISAITNKVQSEIPITVFFVEGTTEEQILEQKSEFESRPEVEKVEYISADQAWEEWSKDYFGDSSAAEGFKDDNPLVNSSSLQIYLKDIQNQALLIEYIKTLPIIRSYNQSAEAANTLTTLNKVVYYGSIGVIAVLLIISIFLISNTVSVGITVRKEEIGLMKLMGATDGFVRAPFILEGMLLGLIGSAIPLAALYYLYHSVIVFVLTKFNVFTNFVEFIPVQKIYLVLLPVGLLLGIGIGFAASITTTKKHLRV